MKRQGFIERLSQYTVLGKLGKGAFGIVVLAQHKYSEVKVAIKLIDKRQINQQFTEQDEIF